MKTIIWILLRLTLRVFWILPIKSNRLLFFSFSGKQYSCNPKYISEHINNFYSDQFEIIWAFTNPGNYEDLESKGIKVVQYDSFQFLKYFFSSKVIVTNDSFHTYLEKRKSQFLIQTWHGGGAYKKVGQSTGLYNKSVLMRSTFIMRNVDLYLSSCKKFTKHLIREAFAYEGHVLEKGMPRNDFLISNGAQTNKVKEQYGIPKNNLLVVYAPTFRQELQTTDHDIDYSRIIESLEKKYNRDSTILYRIHHKIPEKQLSKQNVNNLVNVSDYPDMQEILHEADILITDYSSSMWDFSLMYKPCFIYAVDTEKYTNVRDFYTPMKDWPFPLATNNDELISNILNFNVDEYTIAIKKHHRDLGSYETGHATEAVLEYIFKTCFNKK
jgi:CDP-glycerol glycerophosphotransferase